MAFWFVHAVSKLEGPQARSTLNLMFLSKLSFRAALSFDACGGISPYLPASRDHINVMQGLAGIVMQPCKASQAADCLSLMQTQPGKGCGFRVHHVNCTAQPQVSEVHCVVITFTTLAHYLQRVQHNR